MALTATIKQIIFFSIIFVFFVLFAILSNRFGLQQTKGKWVLGLLAIFYTLGIYGYTKAVGLFRESYCYQTSPGKLCQGGWYMNQGDSPRAKMCRAMMASPEGQAEIDQYSCGKGYTGMKACNFRDTTMSNANWENEMCKTRGSCEENANSYFGSGLGL